MSHPADEAILSLIEDLIDMTRRCTFDSEEAQRQIYINQICQLRASMNPVIIQKSKKD